MKDYYRNKSILFWPGKGQSNDVLYHFNEQMGKYGHSVTVLPFPYDTEDDLSTMVMELQQWLNTYHFDWWIGLSLGASLAYYCSSVYLGASSLRLSCINPFNDRMQLSHEIGFDISRQWVFSASSATSRVGDIDIILSLYDKKIPHHHGLELLTESQARRKSLVIVESDHTISNIIAQKELVSLLCYDEHFNYYCHVYKG